MLPEPDQPTLHVFAGPNGAGKSTLFRQLAGPYPQVNADVIQAENPQLSGVGVGLLMSNQIKELRANRATFSLETNLAKQSHYNTFQGYQQQGYRVTITFVGLASALDCKERVAACVQQGGHYIPEKQIEERYTAGLALLKKNYHVPDQLVLVDNTVRPTVVLVVEQGRIIWQAPDLPT